MFKLNVIQAKFGDSMLIEYGESDRKYILIDGGPSGVYHNSLRNEILRIVGEGGTLEAVIISHVDIDHIKGIMDLLAELTSQKDNGSQYLVNVKEIWLNNFSEIIPEGEEIVQRLNEVFSVAEAQNFSMNTTAIALHGIKEGERITQYANILDIPINTSGHDTFYQVSRDQQDIIFSNLKFIIVGPTKENLRELRTEWGNWLAKQERAIDDGTFDILSMSDKSIPNLSSIAFLVEGNGRTVLFTGDGRGDHLLSGLKDKGLLVGGEIKIDILKVPHHASDRNVDFSFFKKVIADTYVISADGKHGNPDFATLKWIVEAAYEDGRKIELVITNETESTIKILGDYPPAKYGYSITYIPSGKFSVEV